MKQNEEILGKSADVLHQFSDFLLKWQKSVNLISPTTVPDVWNRHILDCAQVYNYIPGSARVLADMGTGGGLPGMVLALMNKANNGPLTQLYFLESDTKKSIFLKEAVRTFQVPVTVLNERIEKVFLDNVDVVTARALKPLNELLELGHGIINPETVCFFLKGKNADKEIRQMTVKCVAEKIPSLLNSDGCIVKLKGVKYE